MWIKWFLSFHVLRYHLQALRHFYVLATQPRLLLPKDIDTKHFCYVNVRLTFQSKCPKDEEKIIVRAPCLLPQLNRLEKVEINDDRYWKIIFEKDRNFDQLEKILGANCVLDVKQRAGCLSREEDPQVRYLYYIWSGSKINICYSVCREKALARISALCIQNWAF